ncbi:rhamnogalacturonan lyase [Actinotalea ferrariae]|uniref:rhamnogalacturonan lyase n=1 Tax=Actinotalea ferrariae TaxID=1386098 RepID=UPI001C8CC95C|nr:rhamnogalacturonan lyase [Actinotalea ferrariae]MBX9245930.1 rhamnogalacturonan lyase [Actinotalea ferrariae]
MSLGRARIGRQAVTAVVASALVVTGAGAAAAGGHGQGHGHGPQDPVPAGVQLERLDRGLVAATTPEGVFLSWRLLATEVTGSGPTGMVGADFHVYRGDEFVATVTDSTNYLDAGADGTAAYRVAAVVDGAGVDVSASVDPWAQPYATLPLTKPADGVTPPQIGPLGTPEAWQWPEGEPYTYAVNDMSVGDVDGDGALEYLVKWDPSNAKDVSQKGYTGPVYVDAYEADGTLLYRLDLGVNIRAGAHYTQFLVYDFDGDGRSEVMLKTAPGTSTVPYAGGVPQAAQHITLPADDVAAGVSHDDDYRLSAAQYRDHLAGMLQGWQEHPEVVAGSWPATLEEAWGIEPRWTYPLTEADAYAAADFFIQEWAPGRSARNELAKFEGFVLDGPEYLTVFDGASGAELQTVRYTPDRHDDGLMWGDYAMSRIEPGNRVDRFLSGVAYLDGSHPSAIFARGYYTRSTITAYDWDGEQITERWFVDSGWTPMTNPFNDGPHGRAGTDPEFGSITTQGFHSLSAADVDGDGKHEIVYGSATIDHDGSLLYSSFDTLPEGSADPGASAGLGHGDAMHVTDIDPDRPGLEIFTVHEGGTFAPYGMAMRDAATGEVLWGQYSGRDTGRGMIGDVLPDSRGVESWASMPGGSDALGLHTPQGEVVSDAIPGTNQSVRWAADMTTQLVNGSGDATPTIDDWQRGTLRTLEGTRTNNGTKGNPSLVADVLGDWREEVLVRTADSSAIQIHLSTEVTDRKLYTLLHDVQYRAEVARQQTTYNQPSYTSFYLASDLDWSQVPVPDAVLPGSFDALGDALERYVRSGEVSGLVVLRLYVAYALAEHHLDKGRPAQAARALEAFERTLDTPWRWDRVTPTAKASLQHLSATVRAMLT